MDAIFFCGANPLFLSYLQSVKLVECVGGNIQFYPLLQLQNTLFSYRTNSL